MYSIKFEDQAKADIAKLKKSESKVFKKLAHLLEELQDHPKEGTGKPKPLSANMAGLWSRRITDKHRLVYQIRDEEVLVLVLSAWGHYGDK